MQQQSRIKSLASDTLIYGLFTIIGRFLTFMLTPIYSNYMNMSEVGDILNILSIIVFVNIMCTLGMDSAYFRFYKKDNLEESKKVFSHSFLSIFFLGLLYLVVCIICSEQISPLFTNNPNGKYYVIIAVFIPFLDSLMVIPYALLRLLRKAFKFSIIRFILIILSVLLNIIFIIFMDMGGMGVLLAQAISSLIGVLIILPEIIAHFKIKLDFKMLKEMFLFGIPTVPASFSAYILQLADVPILRALASSQDAGLYRVNYRLGIPMMMFVSVFEYAWKPFYLSHYEDQDAKPLFSRIFTYFTLISAFIFLLVGFFIEFIVKIPFLGGEFINHQYWGGLGIIPIILGGYYFNGAYTNFVAGFQIQKKTQYLPIAIGIGAIINIIINFITIPIFGFWGAAWATLIAYFISAIILYFFTLKIYPIQYEWKRVFIILCSTISCYMIGIELTKNLDIVYSLVVRFFIFFLYFALLFIFKLFDTKEIQTIKSLFQRK